MLGGVCRLPSVANARAGAFGRHSCTNTAPGESSRCTTTIQRFQSHNVISTQIRFLTYTSLINLVSALHKLGPQRSLLSGRLLFISHNNIATPQGFLNITLVDLATSFDRGSFCLGVFARHCWRNFRTFTAVGWVLQA